MTGQPVIIGFESEMPKTVDKESKRKEIARIAMELFAHNGFENTPIREITTKAGMGKGTFYDYFKDKEDLLCEVAHLLFGELSRIVLEKVAHIEDPTTQLAALLKEAAKIGDDFELLVLTYLDIWRRSFMLSHEAEHVEIFHKHLNVSKETIAAIIDSAKEQGCIRDDVDSSTIATVLVALIDGLCIHSLTSGSNVDVDTIIQGFFDALMNGMRP